MKNSIFITATGTDVGKTYISGLLVKKIVDLGVKCAYYKPVLSGALVNKDGSLFLGDAEFVIKTAELKCLADKCVSYTFEEAVSPHLAAKRMGVTICLDKITEDYNKIASQSEFVVVEGAGGITCPLAIEATKKLLLPDVIKALGLSVIIVADAGLGTINSTLLTIEYAKAQNISILGIVLNNYDKNNFMHQDNKAQIEKLAGVRVIATVENGARDLDISNEVIESILRVK